ncbi:MAG: phospholipid carrier-dependent glycosyltransferase [Deltaproteobacteria bacterium]|nr:phospholipid carrier-dependent glycosyltransferase [Deltaproteobacteria bacterium]
MKNGPLIPKAEKRPFRIALLSIIGIQTIFSFFLIFRFPQADCTLTYLVAMHNVESGVYHLGTDPTPNDFRVVKAKDGYVHATYEPGIPHLYSLMISAGHKIDSALFKDNALWQGWDKGVFSAKYAMVELPHLLVLPVTCALIFLMLTKMGCSLATTSWISLLGAASTIIPWNASPIARDGLGLPFSVASFYFAFSGRVEGKDSRRRLWYFGAGVSSGLAVLMKLTTATVAAPVFFYIALSEWRRQGNSGGRLVSVAVFTAPLLVATVLFFLDRWLVFGSIFAGPINTSIENYSIWIPIYEGLFGLLMSPGKGLFWYNPILVLLFASWGVFKDRWTLESHAFLIHAVVLIFPLAAQSSWAGDEAYGPRYMLSLIPWGLIVVGCWLDQRKKNAFLKSNLLAITGILVQLPALLVSLTTAGVAHKLSAGWAFPHKHFWPSLSPIVLFWKALLSKLSNGYFYGESHLWSPTTQYPYPPMVDFAETFAWRETFFYEIVHLKWDIAIPFLVIAAIASGICLYGLVYALKKNSLNP